MLIIPKLLIFWHFWRVFVQFDFFISSSCGILPWHRIRFASLYAFRKKTLVNTSNAKKLKKKKSKKGRLMSSQANGWAIVRDQTKYHNHQPLFSVWTMVFEFKFVFYAISSFSISFSIISALFTLGHLLLFTT